MICHVWSMTIKPEATLEQRRALLDGMAKLPSEIPGILSFRSGADLGLNPGNADIVLVAEFEDELSWRTYLDAPAHQQFATELVDPVYESGIAIQIGANGK